MATAFRVARSRGADALHALVGDPVGPVVVCDRFPTYARAPNRQICWAHLRRDMQSMIDRAAGGEAVGAKLITGPVGAYEAMYFNIHGTDPYDLGSDIAVREAVSIAIDRQQVIDSAWQGMAEPGTTMIPPAILGDSVSLVTAPELDAECRQR